MKNKTVIIAEAGINHNGNLSIAKKLIDAAKEAGADIVKFQIYKTDLVVQKKIDKKIKDFNPAKFHSLLKKLELSYQDFFKLKKYSKKKQIIFAATPFDKISADELEKLNVPFYKISSGDINNYELIEHIVKKNRPIILSTGRSTLAEIKKTVLFIKKLNFKKYSILHCVSEYPAQYKNLNLNAIKLFKKNFKCKIGFSDHSRGIEAALAAVAIGADYIEKHITLNVNDLGPDHKASTEPKEFKEMVSAIRNIEIALGEEKKIVTKPEIPGKIKNRRSIFAKINLPKNTKIKKNDLICKRPVVGISSDNFQKMAGFRVTKNIKKNEPIFWNNIKKIS